MKTTPSRLVGRGRRGTGSTFFGSEVEVSFIDSPVRRAVDSVDACAHSLAIIHRLTFDPSSHHWIACSLGRRCAYCDRALFLGEECCVESNRSVLIVIACPQGKISQLQLCNHSRPGGRLPLAAGSVRLLITLTDKISSDCFASKRFFIYLN